MRTGYMRNYGIVPLIFYLVTSLFLVLYTAFCADSWSPYYLWFFYVFLLVPICSMLYGYTVSQFCGSMWTAGSLNGLSIAVIYFFFMIFSGICGSLFMLFLTSVALYGLIFGITSVGSYLSL